MSKQGGFLKLIRLPNLLFIVLTQALFQFCIYQPIYKQQIPVNDHIQFVFLCLASVCIAAAGYVINDYFDINIDMINKPGKMVIGKTVGRRWALVWHMVLNVAGIVFTAIAVNPLSRWYLVVANIICVALLWLYSARFKKDVLIGNVIVSLLTAWTILIIFFSKYSLRDAFLNADAGQVRLFRFALLYAGFAFILSLVREAVKDIEDMDGDAKYGCKTMPIEWGVNATKVYCAVWLTILIIALAVIQVYVLQFQWWWAVVYCFAGILIPAAWLFRKLMRATITADYRQLSGFTKIVMLMGILSMIFFYIYLI